MLESAGRLGIRTATHISCINEYRNQDHGVIAAFDGCIVTTRAIPDLNYYFCVSAKHTIFSLRGIISIKENDEAYGIGMMAREAAVNNRFLVRAAAIIRESTCRDSTDESGAGTAYVYTVTPNNLSERRSFLSQAQDYAVSQYGIPITISLWRSIERKFTTLYDHTKHQKYAGFFLPE